LDTSGPGGIIRKLAKKPRAQIGKLCKWPKAQYFWYMARVCIQFRHRK